jgi:hypothetical protein
MQEPANPLQQNPAIPYLVAFIVFVVIASFTYVFGIEILFAWNGHPPLPDWVKLLQHPINALATLVAGIVAVAFSIKPPSEVSTAISTQSLPRRNLFSLGEFMAPSGKMSLKVLLGMLYAIIYVGLGFAAIGTWVLRSKTITPDTKSLATTFLGMIVPIVVGFFSKS